MNLQEAYKQKMAAQLKEWSAQINLMEAKVENAGADLKVRHAEQLDELRAKQRAAAGKMEELEQASSDAWEQIKVAADKAWDDLKTGLADAHDKFK